MNFVLRNIMLFIMVRVTVTNKRKYEWIFSYIYRAQVHHILQIVKMAKYAKIEDRCARIGRVGVAQKNESLLFPDRNFQ